MKNPELEDLKNRIELLENGIAENDDLDENELAENVYELEAEIICRIDNAINEREFNAYEKLLHRLKKIIHEHEFFDEETELDIMRAEKDDFDFDSDSMSSDRFFGDDD